MRVLNWDNCFSKEDADELSFLPNGQMDTMVACRRCLRSVMLPASSVHVFARVVSQVCLHMSALRVN